MLYMYFRPNITSKVGCKSRSMFFRLMILTCLIAASSCIELETSCYLLISVIRFFTLSDSHVHTQRSKHDFYLNTVRVDVCKCFITFARVQI